MEWRVGLVLDVKIKYLDALMLLFFGCGLGGRCLVVSFMLREPILYRARKAWEEEILRASGMFSSLQRYLCKATETRLARSRCIFSFC